MLDLCSARLPRPAICDWRPCVGPRVAVARGRRCGAADWQGPCAATCAAWEDRESSASPRACWGRRSRHHSPPQKYGYCLKGQQLR